MLRVAQSECRTSPVYDWSGTSLKYSPHASDDTGHAGDDFVTPTVDDAGVGDDGRVCSSLAKHDRENSSAYFCKAKSLRCFDYSSR